MRKNAFAILAMAAAGVVGSMAMPTLAANNKLIVNEANCVTGDVYLKGSASDSGMVGVRVQGNGNNWIELLVAGDEGSGTVDLRDYEIVWAYDKEDSSDEGAGRIRFKNVSEWSAVKTGTLITISEYAAISYNPNVAPGTNNGHARWAGIDGYGVEKDYVSGKTINDGNFIDLYTNTAAGYAVNDDWHKHYYAGDNGIDGNGDVIGALTDIDENDVPFAYSEFFEFRGEIVDEGDTYVVGLDPEAGLFPINNDNWQCEIVDGVTQVMDPIGEDLGTFGGSGIGNDEVLKLEKIGDHETGHNLSAVTPFNYQSAYGNGLMKDGRDSTMGSENKWDSTGTLKWQTFEVLGWAAPR